MRDNPSRFFYERLGGQPNEQFGLETAATTRLLESEGILDYSGHVAIRIPDRDALMTAVAEEAQRRFHEQIDRALAETSSSDPLQRYR